MAYTNMTRRAVFQGAAGLATWTALAGLPLATTAARAQAPHPIQSSRRGA